MITRFDLQAKDWDNVPIRIERAQAAAAAMRQMGAFAPGATALEYGCGTGLLSFALHADLGSITLADSSAGMLAVLREKIAAAGIQNMTPVLLDLACDPLPEQRFQVIYTLMTLHHIQDTAQILASFHALLEQPGCLCIADLDREDGSFHAHEPDFAGHNGFERAALHAQLLAAGFEDVQFTTFFEITKGGRTYPLFLAVARKLKPMQIDDFNTYQRESRKTWRLIQTDHAIVYPTLGLANEAGEVAGKVKKLFRDKGGQISAQDREALKQELGDVLWYLAQICTELDLSLQEVAEANLVKLFSRLERGTIQGDGDQR